MERNETKTAANGDISKLASAENIVTVAVATTLTKADSGKVIVLNASTGAAITLPSVTSKWNFKFLVGAAFATTNWTVVAPTSVIQGGAIVNSTYVPGVNENTISFVASAETIGDFIDVYSDGTNILSSGVGAASGSITYTAV